MLLAMLASRAAIAAGLPADVGAGTLLFRTSPAELAPAPRLSTDVTISIAGFVARVALTQQFENTGSEWVEGVYLFPLPDDAAVDRLTMRIGERLIVGEIREREQAERIYNQAKDAGQHAGLVAQERPNLFTTSVANIAPGQRIEITIEYLQTARYDAGELSLRFPMTLTPRYAPAGSGASGGDTAADEPVAGILGAAFGRDAHNEARIRVSLDAGMPLAQVGSRHHDVRVTRGAHGTKSANRYGLEPVQQALPMDRDFIVTWRPAVGAAPAVAAVTETVGDATFALLMILPSPQAHLSAPQPRELIFVIDTSGSMGGPSIEQAKLAVANALGRLSGGDRFNVFEFNTTTSSLYRLPAAFTATTYSEALDYVGRLTATGGTEMAPAIRAALAQPTASGYLRQVVFLTDGGVANEAELFKVIKQQLGDARLFTVGIGAAPNSYFMRKAAQFGRGTYTHIGDAAEVAEEMTALFDKLEHVALTDVVADWPDAVEVFPYQAPDLYAGEPIVLAGRLDGPLDRPISVGVVGRAAGTPWSETVEIGPGAAPGIAALWARRKIEHVTDARVDGLSEDLIRKLVVGVALEHNLVSRYTSLVAVDKTPARAPAATSERRAAANMLPAGAVLGQFPQTASAAPLYRWLGMLLLALAVLAGLSVRRPLHRRFLQRLRRRLLRPLRSRVLPRLRRAECAS